MRNYSNDYLSEFEREFEAEFEADEIDGENEFEFEADDELEDDSEFEFEGDYDTENDLEMEFQTDNSYETRLYEILNNNYESELEFENNVNEVLHEMEKDFFFGSLKKWMRKRGGIKGLLAKYAKKLPISGAINAISAAARGDFRGALRNIASNGLLRTGLSFLPGGGIAAKGLDFVNRFANSNSETEQASMENVQEAVAVGRTAYDNLARNLVNAESEQDVREMGRKAMQQAIMTHNGSASRNGRSTGRRKRIAYPAGSVVTVHPNFISISQPS